MPKNSFTSFIRLMNNRISHSGIVDSVVDGCVTVRILQTSAGAACKVASHCNASESKEKLVDVRCSDAGYLQAGAASDSFCIPSRSQLGTVAGLWRSLYGAGGRSLCGAESDR